MDPTVVVDAAAEQGAAAGSAVEDQVKGHGLVAVRALDRAGEEQSGHRPGN
ncbi:hypothetical protein GTZ78_07520 [Streptomyces sp. SID8361]|uniref:hypothetical protein n=1 Tax=Streptomyces sp. MnatMP-M27 TaxID=1839768 RepID=UPI00144C7CE3|nr:hypothetical protein [Streptomyces sp. MnatMP-M27]MYU10540.1 hypothetical protein [Streptomyces sp. SID8361]